MPPFPNALRRLVLVTPSAEAHLLRQWRKKRRRVRGAQQRGHNGPEEDRRGPLENR